MTQRALFFVEPLVLHSRPFHYWAWLGHFAEMAHALRAAGWEVRVVVNEALAVRALAPRAPGAQPARLGRGLPPEEVVVLLQEPIRRLFGVPNVALIESLHGGRAPRAALDGYAALVRAALGGFVPDVMLALTPAEQLRVAFPGALLLATETGAFSRPPYPPTVFFDPGGFWDRSVLATHAAAVRDRAPAPAERALLERLRARFGGYFRAVSRFGPLEDELRARHRRLGFLPLQFGGEPGFDCNAPFATQGEYLYHVLERLPPDVGLVAVEHPTAHWLGDFLDEETREHLRERHPSLHLVDFREAPSAGQLLVGHTDFTISVSSSLGLQALFAGKPLVAVGTSHLAAYASLRGLDAIPPDGALPAPGPEVDRALAWMLSHYFVPLELCRRPAWLGSFFERLLGNHRAGRRGLDFFEPVASAEELGARLSGTLDQLASVPMRGRIENGAFTRWPHGSGPFAVGGEGPAAWHLLDFGGGVASVQRARGDGGDAASVRRIRAGTGPTFLLQRVPDVESCAGALARLRFRARSAERATLLAYLYLQVDDGQPGVGTQAQPFPLTPTFSAFEHVGPVPDLGGRAPGRGSHVEVVFVLAPEAGAVSFELADVALEPALL